MWDLRNGGGISLFLFGTTYLWLTPALASRGVPTAGMLWANTRVLAMLTLAGFTVASWGLFQRSGWWLPVAVVSSVVGLVGLVVLVVLVLLLVPSLQRWVQTQVMGS